MMNKLITRLGRPLVALMGAFVLAIAHQYLFYDQALGVSYPIFVGLLYLYMFYNAKDQRTKPTLFGWTLFGAILLLSLTYVLFHNPFFRGLNFIVVPSLFFLHMTYTFSTKRPAWFKPQMIVDGLDHLIVQSLRHVPTAFRLVKTSAGSTMGERRKATIGKVLMGIVIAMPLMIIVISLLTSADGAFDQLLSGIPGFLSHFSFGEGIFRFIWLCVVCVLLFGYLWGFIDSKKFEWGHNEASDPLLNRASDQHIDRATVHTVQYRSDPFKLELDPIVTATVLVAINIVYVLFVIVQFSYLFGAGEGMLTSGSSYADYARSGFFELIAVTTINFALLMGTIIFSKTERNLLQRINNIMLYILVTCSCVMLYSAFIRLVLYEQAYGYTYIRFLVHAFMIFLAVLLIIAGLRIHFKTLPLAKFYIVFGIVSYVILNYMGMDHIIAENNIVRYQESGVLDEEYLHSLSTDAIPTIINFSQEEHSIMDEHLTEQWKILSEKDRDWASFNLSVYRAERALEDYLGT
ncbi:hypothetical protein PNBC_17840 [Paenibacillus crassostreae]|uniref:Uncharacterized protein n=2 Tax=Paenibacillus crassostreae TaxID=1763538 RepID=A0A167B9N4_9BACL|nr:hypothetical protein LPB68_13050 [Paenibacillus crassostreae]OAB71862.1 hypothetical protein PNBC_17840 [Paenibacillus crassostreae]